MQRQDSPKARVVLTRFIWFWLLASFAASQANELQENYYPIRALGMGNAFTAIANDESSIWLNPAGISRVRKHRSREQNFWTKLPVLGLGLNSNAKNLYDTSKNLGGSLQKAIESTNSLGANKTSWAHYQAAPVMMYNFAPQFVGATSVYSQGFVRILVPEEDSNSASLTAQTDNGFAQSFAWTNNTNRMSFGLTFRYISRGAYEDIVDVDSVRKPALIKERYTNFGNSSVGYGLDMGLMFTFADFWFPTLGISVLNLPLGCQSNYLNPATKMRENVCGTKFTGKINNPDALGNLDPTDLRMGVSMTPRISPKVALRLGLDIHHFYTKVGSQNWGLKDTLIQKMIHTGAELVFGNPLVPSHFSVRAGMGQGFFSAGMSAWIYGLELQLTTYSADLSADAKSLEDRRTLAGVAYAW